MQKIVLNKNPKFAKNRFFQMHFFTPSKKVGSNLKPDFDRILSEFSETGPKYWPTSTNDWENCSWSWCKKRYEHFWAKSPKIVFFKCVFWPLPKKLDPIWNLILIGFCLNFIKLVWKIYLPLQMTEKIAVEVDAKNVTDKSGQNRQKSFFSNAFFDPFQNSWPRSETWFW